VNAGSLPYFLAPRQTDFTGSRGRSHSRLGVFSATGIMPRVAGSDKRRRG
jgi:hypothetical protein